MRTSRRKTAARRRRQFGTVPEVNYFPGDMGHIRSYFDFRRDTGRDGFLLDEITWNDLEGDEVFRRINPGLTTSGEQYLYYMLRSPARDEGTWTGRRALIGLMGRDGELRVKLQVILSRLGRARRADLCGAFYPSERGPGWLLVYLAMVIAVIAGKAMIEGRMTVGVVQAFFQYVNQTAEPMTEASNLSAGQRQLLTIARVFLCNPPILILDEATSSVDTRTEVEIGKAMKKLMSGRISFVIAHRLSTIRDADIILFMEKGTIIEQGSHKELLEKNGAYAKLYYSQFE